MEFPKQTTCDPSPPSPTDYLRASVHCMIEALPEAALKEAVERLAEMVEFYQEKEKSDKR